MICACDTEYFFLEGLAKKETRIYPDACDMGYEYNSSEAPKIKQAVQSLMEVYKYTVTKGSWIWTVEMFIPFEKDGYCFHGVRVIISQIIDKNRKFLHMEQCHQWQATSGFKND